LADRGDSFPDVLSGGEQQRVAIARALAHSPSVLLADEPTGNLDTETGEQILELLMTTVREQQTTLIMVTHSHELATRADRIMRLQAGRLEQVPR
jgi:putative ABC transport system ATP-binding protein